MARHIQQIGVFISSPSDVALERDIAEEAIQEINRIRGNSEGFSLLPVRWERDVGSQFGSHPQSIINQQIGDEYDIFVGIMCSTFGSTAENFGSGTEEEFERALQRVEVSEKPTEILFYFKDPRKSESPIDAHQFLKVDGFKQKIASKGVYCEFETPEGLKTSLLADLSKATDRFLSSSKVTSLAESSGGNEKPETGCKLIETDDFDEDIGILELSDIVFDSLENFNDTLSSIGSATTRFGLRIEEKTLELGKLPKSGNARQDQKKSKPYIEKIAAEMQRLSHKIDLETPIARKDFSMALKAMQRAVLVMGQDGLSKGSDNDDLARQLRDLKVQIEGVVPKLSEFKTSIANMPRLTSKLNQAKRRALGSIDELIKFVTDACSIVEKTLGALES